MFTIDLEKKMISGKKAADKATELAVKEVETLLSNLHEEDTFILQKLGMVHNIQVVKQENDKELFLSAYDKTRVFHINEIKKISKRYALRFLPTKYYSGTIDPLLPSKIKNFEKTYSLNDVAYYICAPKSSFKLETKPKDPLLFAKLNEEYYYLVHKWGNDLSFLRRILGFLSNPWRLMLVLYIPFIIASIITSRLEGLCSIVFIFTAVTLSNAGEGMVGHKWASEFE